MGRFLEDNKALNDALDAAFDDSVPKAINLDDRSDQSIFYLYVIGIFDIEVQNGGIAQFYQNRPHLGKHVNQAFDFFNLRDISKKYKVIHSAALKNWNLLETHWKAGTDGGAAVYDDESPERETWFETWAAFRDAMKPSAGLFESLYYGSWQDTQADGDGPAGSLCSEISEACCELIEREPELFQAATVN